MVKRVLFVCIENSARSQMAEAFARMHGKGKIEPYSVGSRPSRQVTPMAINCMREVGYDLGKHQSKSLNEIPDVEYDFVVTMGCGDECPLVRGKHREDWDITDPKGLSLREFREIRDSIEARVKSLLSRL